MGAPGQTDFRAQYHFSHWLGGYAMPWLNMLVGNLHNFLPSDNPSQWWGAGVTETLWDLIDERGIPLKDSPLLTANGYGSYWFTPLYPRHYPEQEYIVGWTGTGGIRFNQGVFGFEVLENDGNRAVFYRGASVITPPVAPGSTHDVSIRGTDVRVKLRTTWLPQIGVGNDTWNFAKCPYNAMGIPYWVKAKYETNYHNGEIIDPDYAAYLKNQNMRVMRYMYHVPQEYTTTAAPFTHGCKVDSINWCSNTGWGTGAGVWPRSIFVGEIKSADGVHFYSDDPLPSGLEPTIQQHEQLWGIVKADNAANPTLNIAGRGAKPIFNHMFWADWFTPFGVGYFAPSANGRVFTFVYDELGDGYIAIAGIPDGGWWPIQAVVELCNKAEAGLWYCFPNYTSNKEVYLITKYVAEHLDHGPFVSEWSNEVWGGVKWGNNYSYAMSRAISLPEAADQQWMTDHGLGPAQPSGYNWFYTGKSYKLSNLMPEIERGWLEGGRDRNDLKIGNMIGPIYHNNQSTVAEVRGDFLRFWKNGRFEHLIPKQSELIDCMGIAAYGRTAFDDHYSDAYGNRQRHQYMCDLSDLYVEGDADAKALAVQIYDNSMRGEPVPDVVPRSGRPSMALTRALTRAANDSPESLRGMRENYYPLLQQHVTNVNAFSQRHVTAWNYEGRPTAGAPTAWELNLVGQFDGSPVLTANFVMPNVGASATAQVNITSGEYWQFTVGTQYWLDPVGHVRISAISGNSLTVVNEGDVRNQPAGSPAPAGSRVMAAHSWGTEDAYKYGRSGVSAPGRFLILQDAWKRSALARATHYDYVREFMQFEDFECQGSYQEGSHSQAYDQATGHTWHFQPFLWFTDSYLGETEYGWFGVKDWNDNPLPPVYIHERDRVFDARYIVNSVSATAGTAPTNIAVLNFDKTHNPDNPLPSGSGLLATVTFQAGSTTGQMSSFNSAIARINPGDTISVRDTAPDPTFQEVHWSMDATPLADLIAPPLVLPGQDYNLDFGSGVFLWNGTPHSSLEAWMAASGATYERTEDIDVTGLDGERHTIPAGTGASAIAINHRYDGTHFVASGMVDNGTGKLTLPGLWSGGATVGISSLGVADQSLVFNRGGDLPPEWWTIDRSAFTNWWWNDLVNNGLSIAGLWFANNRYVLLLMRGQYSSSLEWSRSYYVNPFKLVASIASTAFRASINGEETVSSTNGAPANGNVIVAINGELRCIAKSPQILSAEQLQELSAWEEEEPPPPQFVAPPVGERDREQYVAYCMAYGRNGEIANAEQLCGQYWDENPYVPPLPPPPGELVFPDEPALWQIVAGKWIWDSEKWSALWRHPEHRP